MREIKFRAWDKILNRMIIVVAIDFDGARVTWKIMQGEASSVAKFNHECLEHEIDNWISNADLYDKYTEFCELNNITIIETDQKFAKDIRRYCNFGKFGAQKGTGITGVRNVKVKKVLPIFGI